LGVIHGRDARATFNLNQYQLLTRVTRLTIVGVLLATVSAIVLEGYRLLPWRKSR